MGLSVDGIVAKFPIKTLPTINNEPDYGSINNMVQILYGNAAALATTLRGGQHGHIGLIMTPLLYATLTATPHNQPIDPGPTPPLLPVNASAAAHETGRIKHKEARRIYDNNNNMDNALKAQIINTMGDTYLYEMQNKYTGYLGVTTCDLINHLLDR
jgi:hypothetical protein